MIGEEKLDKNETEKAKTEIHQKIDQQPSDTSIKTESTTLTMDALGPLSKIKDGRVKEFVKG